MRDQPIEKISIPPEEDARLPILEAKIEKQWMRFRQKYYQRLKSEGQLAKTVRETALDCIRLMNQYEEHGLNPDQAREAMQELIQPDPRG
jgi:hypothetical protein